jgi:hypothetical protein
MQWLKTMVLCLGVASSCSAQDWCDLKVEVVFPNGLDKSLGYALMRGEGSYVQGEMDIVRKNLFNLGLTVNVTNTSISVLNAEQLAIELSESNTTQADIGAITSQEAGRLTTNFYSLDSGVMVGYISRPCRNHTACQKYERASGCYAKALSALVKGD